MFGIANKTDGIVANPTPNPVQDIMVMSILFQNKEDGAIILSLMDDNPSFDFINFSFCISFIWQIIYEKLLTDKFI